MNAPRRGIELILDRVTPPPPWAEGDNIPWNEPGFSERMLREHLTQDHDLASRRSVVIDAHIPLIVELLPGDRSARILDLACGPGLYAHRLARLGHMCHGIDFSPAAIAYARDIADGEDLPATFDEADLRDIDFGSGYDLALMIYGQINVFRREQALDILHRAYAALEPGGRLLLEPLADQSVRELGRGPRSWSTHERGLFSDTPHLLLEESFWDEPTRTATQRWYVVDLRTGAVRSHSLSTTAYELFDWDEILASIGFRSIEHRPAMVVDEEDPHLSVVLASKPQ